MILRTIGAVAVAAALCSACGGGGSSSSASSPAASSPANEAEGSSPATPSAATPSTTAGPADPSGAATTPSGQVSGEAAAIEDPGGVLPYVRFPLPANAVWTASPMPPPASADVKRGAWVFTQPGRSYPSCALRVTVQGHFAGDLRALKVQFEQSDAERTTMLESTLTQDRNGYAQELFQASSGVEQARDGTRHPYTTWAHSIVTRGGTFLQVVGVAHDDAAGACQAEQAARAFTPTGRDLRG